ncbi:sensor histidine kinase [Flavobacterium sp. UBA7682]|uniref:sensor histidine kinase n=1 Tax=Flavobacterium sp. UBA7682 TaxID=1946560 RepID=UPI0025C70828|nr:histidine kinase [Flavobacterium sp. UBA7682]
MKKYLTHFIHIGFWFCFGLIIIVLLAILMPNQNDISKLPYYLSIIFGIALVPSFISFYGFYYLIFKYYVKTKSIFKTFLAALFISVIAAFFGYIVSYFIIPGNCNTTELNGINVAIAMISFMSFIAFVSGTVGFVIKGFVTWHSEIKIKEALMSKTHETEMALVKSQLDPHFLFNTINNIDVLILKDPDIASEYLNKLSDIMRFMLYETKANNISLKKELEYIEKYIELQKIRTSNSTYVTYQVEGNNNGKLIAPMIFIPFIENAFKHCSNKKMGNAISLKITIDENRINFVCTNKYTRGQNEVHGIGSELIAKRLHLLYPNNHGLTINNTNDTYTVNLYIHL